MTKSRIWIVYNEGLGSLLVRDVYEFGSAVDEKTVRELFYLRNEGKTFDKFYPLSTKKIVGYKL